MENNKIVKNLTKGLIITLCFVITMGALYIPTLAVETSPSDINWDDTYFVFYNRTYDDIGDGGMLTFSGSDGTYRYELFDASIVTTHSYTPITVDSGGIVLDNGVGYFILDIYAHIGDHLTYSNGEYLNDTYDELYEVTSNDITIGTPNSIKYRPYLALRHFNGSENNQLIAVRLKIYVQTADNPYDDPLYQLGYDDGYNAGSHDGFNDGYNAGFLDGTEENNTNGFIQTLFRPITALHSAVIYDINGTAQGGEISIGAIFIAILGITGLTAFLKHFAGG